MIFTFVGVVYEVLVPGYEGGTRVLVPGYEGISAGVKRY